MDTAVTERIKKILTRRIGMPPADIAVDARLVDDLGLDSLDSVELAISIEHEFNVGVDEERLAELRTVGDLVLLVERLTHVAADPA